MVVGYGVTVREGSLPVYSVDTEAEAEMLITMACPLNLERDPVAPELCEEQTLENLAAFSDRLHDLYTKYLRKD